jgi:hypothetical protein
VIPTEDTGDYLGKNLTDAFTRDQVEVTVKLPPKAPFAPGDETLKVYC